MKYIILFLLAFLAPALLPAQVKEYYLEADPADFKYLYEHYEEDTYVPCKLTYDGKTWDAEMRIRGDGSRKDPKKSLKIKFSETFLNGHDAINLNSEYTDVSYSQSLMSAYVFRQSGHPVFECEHIRVYLNGSYLGLYLQIEPVDEVFLEKWGLDPKGSLYKSTIDGASLSMYDDAEIKWEKKTNENLNYDDLKDFTRRLNSWTDEEYYDSIRANVDYDNMINLIAVNLMIWNASTYSHNYYLYHNPKTLKWMFIPWDLDKTLGAYGPHTPFDETVGIWMHENPIPERAFIVPKVFEDVKARCKRLNDNVFPSDKIFPLLDSLKTVLRTSAEADTTDKLTDMAKYDEQYEKNKYFFENRYKILDKQFNSQPVNFPVADVNRTYTGPVTIYWKPSKSRNGNPITYNVYYGPKPHYDVPKSVIIKDVKDTFYTINNFEFTGKYYYKVCAFDGQKEIEGFDHINSFNYLPGTELCGEIKSNMTLDTKKSPYIVKCDLIIPAGVTLTVPKGVELHFAENVSLKVNGGTLLVQGYKDTLARLIPMSLTGKWKELKASSGGKIYIENAEISNVMIRGSKSDITLKNCQIKSFYPYTEELALIETYGGKIIIDGNQIKGNAILEGMIIRETENAELINNYIHNIPDCLEMIQCKNSIIANNIAVNPMDDCIDLNNCDYIKIERNLLINPIDKGISIGRVFPGGSNNIEVKNNIVVGANIGIAVKDSSTALISNNTFYSCSYGFMVYNHYPESAPSHAEFVNNIFEKIKFEIYQQKDNCTFNSNYCMTDKELLPGKGNLIASANFENPGANNFHLAANSPAIDAGDPSLLDEDGTRSDIGALYFNQSSLPLVINEINYNSAPERNSGDWVELYNPSLDKSVDISGWVFKDGDDLHNFTMPEGTVLLPDSYLVLLEEPALFKTVYPEVNNILPALTFGFSGAGESLRLYNKTGVLIDSVTYDDAAPWPIEADGKGSTLELINYMLDNTLASSWRANSKGTPGALNLDTSAPLPKLDLNASLNPNPASEYTYVEIQGKELNSLLLELYDAAGERIHKSDLMIKGEKELIYLDLKMLSQGSYYVKLRSKNDSVILKGIKLK